MELVERLVLRRRPDAVFLYGENWEIKLGLWEVSFVQLKNINFEIGINISVFEEEEGLGAWKQLIISTF